MAKVIKEFLMKFLPTPSKTFHRRLDEIQKELANEKARTEAIIAELRKVNNKVNNKEPVKLLYNNDPERKKIASFYGITESNNFRDRFLSLMRGLDTDSIDTVVKILKRQQIIKGTEGKYIDLYTSEEKDKLKIIHENFRQNIFKISDDLYYYKNYLLPINYFEPSIFIDKYGLGNLKNIDSLNDKDIIDVGAFVGDSALLLAPLTNQKVYSFEPVKKNYELMLRTIGLNNIKNVVSENFALGAKQATININVDGGGSSFLMPLTDIVEYQETVRVSTLDEYVDMNLLDIGLIKVDIEGYEQEFLKGAINTIKKYKPIMILSIYHNPDDFFNIKPLIESWDLGYRFKIYKSVDHCISIGALLIAEII